MIDLHPQNSSGVRAQDLDQAFRFAKSVVQGDSTGRRLIRITPCFDGIDLENQMITKVEIRKAWPYYEKSGNIDLEHLTKKGGKNFKEYEKSLFDNGFPAPPKASMGRMYYEIGRPVAGSFENEDCSFLAEIYQGPDDVVAPANWFWKTMTQVTPAWNWKPSVGGNGRTVQVIVDNKDNVFKTHRKQHAELVKDFQWNNVGLTLEPMNHHVDAVQVVSKSKSILKGVDMSESQEVETAPLEEVLKAVLLETAQGWLSKAYQEGEITQLEQIVALGDVSKAFLDIRISGDVDVQKSFGWGNVSTDRSEATDGWAATVDSDEEERKREKRRNAIVKGIAIDFLEDTKAGQTELSKGLSPTSEDSPEVDIAWMLMEAYGCDEDDGLESADLVIKALTGKG